MPTTPHPTWRPITWLPTIGIAIDGGLASAQEFHGTVNESRDQPYSLDEATLARVRRVYGEQAEDVELTPNNCGAGRQGGWMVCSDVRSTELKNQTIEALMRKSDLELGIEALLGRQPGRRRRGQE
jgi:hypothetical protein